MRLRTAASCGTLAATLLAAALAIAGCAAPSRPASATSAAPDGTVTSARIVPGRLGAVAFTAPGRGYGLFARTGGSRCQAQVGRTTDGGARFTGLTVVFAWPCARNGPAVSLAADGAGDVFLFGPRLFVSHDRGTTWAAGRLPGTAARDVLAVSAVGRSVWLLAGDCRLAALPGARQCPIALLESGNGGRSWRPARAQPRGTVASPVVAAEAGQAWLVRTGLRSGYVLGLPTVNPGGRPDRVPLWFTGNGGASWSRRSAPCGMDALYAAAAAAPGGTLFVVCASEPGAGNQEKTTARSADGGRTWTLYDSCPRHPMTCPPLSSGYLGAIAAPTGRDVFLVGGRSALLASHDGGAHWRLVRPPVGDAGGGTFSIVFFGRRNGLVLGDDPAAGERPAIWHTSDGGAHWRPVHPTAT